MSAGGGGGVAGAGTEGKHGADSGKLDASGGATRRIQADNIFLRFQRGPRARIGDEQVLGMILLLAGLAASSLSVQVGIASFVVLFIAAFHGDFWYRSYRMLHRDLSGLLLIILVKYDLWRRMQANAPLGDVWLEVVRRRPEKPAMLSIESDTLYTFREFNRRINRYANYFQSLGMRKGDVVALFMENSVDFVAAWMGLAKLGVVSAWINSNLKAEPLVHCIRTSDAKAVLTTTALEKVLSHALATGDLALSSSSVSVLGESAEFKDISGALDSASDDEPKRLDVVDFKSVLCFIYTSGTTGLPKAAVMKHFRYYSMASGISHSLRISPSDRLYVAMPIYHTAAGILGVGQTLITGSCCVIRRKFSASNFWKDCDKYDCTVSQYIGEMCRYLLAQPPSPADRRHRMRLLFGNGLRTETWLPFVRRFGVRIGELYGSTEGTSSLVNTDGRIGACGFLPISPLTKKMHPVRLVKVHPESCEIVRGPDGLCISCEPGETGAMVSTIRRNNPLLQFEGYLNSSETKKKIIYDVFTKGDSCFLTGDLLHWDRLGYVYFKDRTGDTFRWKGENVSTTEVEAVILPLEGVADATVYGVLVPGTEGRAGMASVARKESSESEQDFLYRLSERLQASLASYAVPLFIRICSRVDKTGTFKLVKTKLQSLGFAPDVNSNNDSLYVFDAKLKQFTPLSKEILADIEAGTFRL